MSSGNEEETKAFSDEGKLGYFFHKHTYSQIMAQDSSWVQDGDVKRPWIHLLPQTHWVNNYK